MFKTKQVLAKYSLHMHSSKPCVYLFYEFEYDCGFFDQTLQII